MNSAPAILWFREDLRITDNPALAFAASKGQPVIPIYVWPSKRSRLALGPEQQVVVVSLPAESCDPIAFNWLSIDYPPW